MKNHLFVAPGDITQLSAHAVAFSASSYLSPGGHLYPAFEAHFPAFAPWYEKLRDDQARERRVGDAFWMTLDPKQKPHGIVVVVSTGGDATEEDKAALAVRAALDEAVRRLRDELGVKGRLLVALPTFRLGGGGDRGRRLHSARVQIKAALEALERLDEVDAAFIAYTPTLYHMFLEARRDVLGPPPNDPMRPADLCAALSAGDCVLFVGAGMSRGAGLPDWTELIDRLAADLHLKPPARFDYLDLAQWYAEQFGRDALGKAVHDTFHHACAALRPTLAHYLLLSLPIRIVITTNYDNLLERALAALKRYPLRILRQEDVPRTGRGPGVHVVKLHGDAAHPDEIVLTRDDYDEFFQRRPAMALLLEGLMLNRTFFFVGYGLKDPNFRQIYSRITRMLANASRPAYATTFETAGGAGEHLTRQWASKRLNLIGMPGDSREEQEHAFLCFLDRLADEAAMHRPRLFLAPDGPPAGPLAKLRDALADEAGGALTTICQHHLGEVDAAADLRALAAVLEFLMHHGWRPHARGRWDLCRLWEELAAHAPDEGERRRCLIAALAAAEAFDDASRVRAALEEMEKKA